MSLNPNRAYQLWLWTNYLTFMSLRLLTCKMSILILTMQGS